MRLKLAFTLLFSSRRYRAEGRGPAPAVVRGRLPGPGACPHLGASLDRCDVIEGQLRCRWHGLPLTEQARGDWAPYPAYDDGVLLWVRLPMPGERPRDTPRLPVRPAVAASVVGVISRGAGCEPSDIIANRLDPWHGAWLHPYAFSDLTVDEAASSVDRRLLDGSFRPVSFITLQRPHGELPYESGVARMLINKPKQHT